MIAENVPRDEAERKGNEAGERVKQSFSANPYVKDLARTPLMLGAICLVQQYEGGELPNDRALVYRLCVEGLLHKWDQARGIKSEFAQEEKLRVCRQLALQMQLNATAETSKDEASTCFEKELGDAIRGAALLDHIRQRAAVLIERRTEVFAFAHLTFQEYLTAVAIHNGDAGAPSPQELTAQSQDQRWQEVIPLYCGITTRAAATEFLKTLALQADHDTLAQLLCESYGSAIREVGRDEGLRDEIALRVLRSPEQFNIRVREHVFAKGRFAQLANQALGSRRFGPSKTLSRSYAWLAKNSEEIDWDSIDGKLSVRFDDEYALSEIIYLVNAFAGNERIRTWQLAVGHFFRPGPRFSSACAYNNQAQIAWIALSRRESRTDATPPPTFAIRALLENLEKAKTMTNDVVNVLSLNSPNSCRTIAALKDKEALEIIHRTRSFLRRLRATVLRRLRAKESDFYHFERELGVADRLMIEALRVRGVDIAEPESAASTTDPI